MRRLLSIAHQLGYQVHISDIEDEPDLLGYTVPAAKMIVLRLGMTQNQTRTVLAHELGHAYYGHSCDSRTNEDQADAFAATLLIDPAVYADLEQISADAHYLAEELGVTSSLIHAYRAHCLTALRGIGYARARMGAGQAQYRSSYA